MPDVQDSGIYPQTPEKTLMNQPSKTDSSRAAGDIPGMSSLLMEWCRLVRLPTVFTALSNILCGYFVTKRPLVTEILYQPDLGLLLLSSAGLYLGGMVLNDVFDAKLDAVERPERPIPSGRISLKAAASLGVLLMLTGIISAACVGMTALLIAMLITVSVLAYDAWLKNTPAGPLGMSACRFLNLLLGTSAGISLSGLTDGPGVWAASGLGLYILGVTWFSRSEAGNSHQTGMIAGLALLLAGQGLDAWMISRFGATQSSIRGGCMGLLLLGLNLTMRATNAITHPRPILIQKTVGLMLLSLIFLDAILVFSLTADAKLAVIVILLVGPASLLRRIIPMS